MSASKPPKIPKVLTAEEWLKLDIEVGDPIFGTPDHCIVRPYTKNIVEAPEKTFKTTFMLRLMVGLSSGRMLFPKLPAQKARKVLYMHGELSPPEIKERTRDAIQGLPRPVENFLQGRDLEVRLSDKKGQNNLKSLVGEWEPEILVLDAWQSFIYGVDENSFSEVSNVTHFLDELIDEFGVTLFLVTHMGKDHSRGTRGHSSLAGWRDTLFRLERGKKSSLVVTVTVDPRWAAPVEPFNLLFENGTVWPTDKSGFTGDQEKMRACVERSGGVATKADVANALGKDMNKENDKVALNKALKRAERAGAIRIDGDEIHLPSQDTGDGID